MRIIIEPAGDFDIVSEYMKEFMKDNNTKDNNYRGSSEPLPFSKYDIIFAGFDKDYESIYQYPERAKLWQCITADDEFAVFGALTLTEDGGLSTSYENTVILSQRENGAIYRKVKLC